MILKAVIYIAKAIYAIVAAVQAVKNLIDFFC